MDLRKAKTDLSPNLPRESTVSSAWISQNVMMAGMKGVAHLYGPKPMKVPNLPLRAFSDEIN